MQFKGLHPRHQQMFYCGDFVTKSVTACSLMKMVQVGLPHNIQYVLTPNAGSNTTVSSDLLNVI